MSEENSSTRKRTHETIDEDAANKKQRTNGDTTETAVDSKRNTVLHVAIKNNETEAALALIPSVLMERVNAKGSTPLILAAARGNLTVVRALLHHNANESHCNLSGVSAFMQAAHFGHLSICKLLFERNRALVAKGSNNNTSPLMRASQGGHIEVVRYLIRCGAFVNHHNDTHMTALMLASQRGQVVVVECLLKAGADHSATHGNANQATALFFACKRGHVDVARSLIAEGCEVRHKDRQGRTPTYLLAARRQRQGPELQRSYDEILRLLDTDVQVSLMQEKCHRERRQDIMLLFKLVQEKRATPTKRVWKHVMEDLSLPLVYKIADFIGLPRLWNKRVRMLQQRCFVDSDTTIRNSLDLMDEVLEAAGFLSACDEARILAPVNSVAGNHTSWAAWRNQAPQRQSLARQVSIANTFRSLRPTQAMVPSPSQIPSTLELRRHAGYLQILSRHGSDENAGPLHAILLSHGMSKPLIQSMARIADIAGLSRRGVRGEKMDATVAMDVVLLTSQLMLWYWQERQEEDPA